MNGETAVRDCQPVRSPNAFFGGSEELPYGPMQLLVSTNDARYDRSSFQQEHTGGAFWWQNTPRRPTMPGL